MKSVQKISSLSLAVLFLVSSLGFTVNKMICIKSGKTKFSLVQMKDCCKDDPAALPVIKSNCCDITNTYFSLGEFHSSDKQTLRFISLVFLNSNYSNFIQEQSSFNQPLTYAFADLPPPRYGRSLLNFISILII